MNILNVENVSKTYMEKTVLDDVSVGISDTDKIGVVGTNGTGKSTLLGIVAGVVSPDRGKVVQGNSLRISYLPQNPVFDMNKTLLENITDTIYAGGDHWDKMGEIKANLAAGKPWVLRFRSVRRTEEEGSSCCGYYDSVRSSDNG